MFGYVTLPPGKGGYKMRYITKPAYLKLGEIISKMKSTKFEISKELGVVASFGDLRENAEFEATKDYQHIFLQRLSRLENIMRDARILTQDEINTTRTSIGTVIAIKRDRGIISRYALLESIEQELGLWSGNFKYASIESPLAQSIIGYKPGEEIVLPNGAEAEISDIKSIFDYGRENE